MSEKTAVEFLAERYNYITWMRNRDEISAGTADEWRAKFLKEAKEMEKEQIEKALSIADVVSSKRFTDTDMLNAYIRGFEDADIDESGLGYVKTDVIIENGLKWLKEYHK